MSVWRNKLTAARFPHLSERLQLLLGYVLDWDGLDREVARIAVNDHGEVDLYPRADAKPSTLGLERDIVLQLRRILNLAGLDASEKQEFEKILHRRAGIILTPRHGCRQSF